MYDKLSTILFKNTHFSKSLSSAIMQDQINAKTVGLMQEISTVSC